MIKTLVSTFLLAVLQATGFDYSADADWLKLPEGRTEIGSMHGTVAVSSTTEVYISVEGTVRQRFAIVNPALQVYSADGNYLRNVPNAPHGLTFDEKADIYVS